ncbi:MAG: nucleotidyltransferase domain-containing protein [Planctomycetota bacterium]
MAIRESNRLIDKIVGRYLDILKENNIPLWRVYIYGSYAKGSYHKESDIDLAVFWDKDDIDGFEEDAQLLKLTRQVDLRIEPHSFARPDFAEDDPYIAHIITTGKRII